MGKKIGFFILYKNTSSTSNKTGSIDVWLLMDVFVFSFIYIYEIIAPLPLPHSYIIC